ncbi:hypothetical protein GQ600_5440 [Phytophthora cactorum]|nr:hypothetical protein GQ600_5440 [Phytophthora cactorum]
MKDSSQTSVVKSDPVITGNAGVPVVKDDMLMLSLLRYLLLLNYRSRLDSLHQFMLKRLRNNELMVDRLAYRWGRLVMRQTLADWKKIIIRKKYTRVLLEKTRSRWTKQHLTRLFRRWNDYAVAEKVRKSNEQIQLYRDSKHDFQELIGRLQVQVEGAKVEMKAHREHLDLAKRHTLSLEELLAQLELRVRQSQERKLQSISNQWGKLCFAFVDCECDYLQNMLDAVSAEDYDDVSVLLMKGEDDSGLLCLPSEQLVLRWINFQLEQCGGSFRHFFSSKSDLIQNFSSDMHGYYALRHILHRVLAVERRRQPAKQTKMKSTFSLLPRAVVDNIATASSLSKQTPFPTREELRTALAELLGPPCPEFLCDHVLSNEMASDLVFCLFGFLVCEHPSLTTQSSAAVSNPASPYPWYEAQVALNDARAIWDSVRLQWRELHTPFDILEATNAPPEMTNAPQLLAKANIALQNAVNTVQYACSKRSSAMRRTRAGPFELVDRRVWRNKYMLTTLPVSKLVQLLLNESDNKQSSEELTEELKLIEEVLGEHYDRLRQVYRYYVNVDFSRTTCGVSGENQPRSGGSAVDEARFFHKISACMSLGEFYYFIKECQVFGRTRPFPYDFVESVFEKVSSDVAASMETATLMLPLTHTLSAPTLCKSGQCWLRGSSKMLSANGFVNCCQHFDLFRDNLLHFDDIQHILAETLQLERESVHFDLAGVATDSEAGASEPEHKAKLDHPEENILLTLTEFLEALAAVACYLNPDAFVLLLQSLTYSSASVSSQALSHRNIAILYEIGQRD